MNAAAATTTNITWAGMSVPSGESPRPERAPRGLIVTRAVELKGGWVGQLIVADDIIWESKPCDTADKAEQKATTRVVNRLQGLLS